MTTKNKAAQALRAIPSAIRSEVSRSNGAKGGRPRLKPGHSQKNIAAVRRWWKHNRNSWEISQLTGLSTALVTEIQDDHL